MATILYYGTDDRIEKILSKFYQDQLKETGETNSIIVAPDEKVFNETIVGMVFEAVFCEQGVLPGNPIDWLTNTRKTKPSLKCPMILVGVEADPIKIMKFVSSGWKDYILLPPDKPLLIEKASMYTSGKRDSNIRQVYSMKMSQQADLAMPGSLEDLSEFDCKIRSSVPVPIDEMRLLYSKTFGVEGAPAAVNVIGRCYECLPHPGFEGQFKISFFFIGITPEALTNIRNTLRKQFISGKSKG